MTLEVVKHHEKPGPSEIFPTIERYEQSNPYSALSKNSQDAYRRDLAKLDSFCQRGGISTFLQLAQGYDAYLTYLRSGNNKDSTVSRRISVTRAFLRWAVDEEITGPEIEEHFPLPKFSKSQPHIIGQDQVSKLIARTRMEKSQRDAALILLMASTGATLSDILKLKSSDIIVEDNQVAVRFDKKGQSRVITLDEQSQEVLLGYLEELKTHQRENVFVLTRQGFFKRVKNYGRDIGFPDLTLLILRNTLRAGHKSRT